MPGARPRRRMDLTELMQVLWRRKWAFLATCAVVMAATAGFLAVQPRVYQSTATLGLTPRTNAGVTDESQQILIFSQIDVITPLYAEAVTAKETAALAQSKLPDGAELGAISVRTFRDAPLVLKVSARDRSPRVAQLSAAAIVEALIQRSNGGEINSPPLLTLVRINRPALPVEPISPRPKLTLIVGAILAVGFGAGAALVLDSLLRKVDTAEQLGQIMGAPVYGEVPSDRSVARLASTSGLSRDAALRVVAEAIRDLRTNLQFSRAEFSSVLVTSPEGRHGKTTVAFGLAVSLARSGARTLLVDGDLRRGRVEEMLTFESFRLHKGPGLWDVLRGLDPEKAVQRTDLDTLHVLTSGALRDDPGELLESAFFSTLFKLERLYDVVVIDGTPLLPINDARIVAKYVSATVVVASAGTLNRRQMRSAAERLEIIGVKPAAVVLNNSRTRHTAGYYAYLEEPGDRASKSAI
ncbi:MAG: polysaccharide biosynthesis tyrosine autokinase [Actinobacteria bacterium]|nr:polysaccharide biosynthesis tyrosine autokinase [Actinomycetota bacterium]